MTVRKKYVHAPMYCTLCKKEIEIGQEYEGRNYKEHHIQCI